MTAPSNELSDWEHYLGCQLLEAEEREERLTSQLQATQDELQELDNRAVEYKLKYQKLDDALEAEQIKTNAERKARKEAEETIAHHRAQVLKLKRGEENANTHCEVAEAEIVKLRDELARERSKTVAWGELSSRLQEDVGRAETSELTAYELVEAARAKAGPLQQDLEAAMAKTDLQELELEAARAKSYTPQDELTDTSEHNKKVESQVIDLKQKIQEEHQRATEAENALSVLTSEVKSKDIHISDLLEKYTALEAKHSECEPVIAIPSNTNNTIIDSQHPPHVKSERRLRSRQEQTTNTNTNKRPAERTLIAPPSKLPIDLAITPPGPPALPKPAVCRPTLASVQAEMFTPARNVLPIQSVMTNKLRWKFLWRIPAETLELMFGCYGRR